MLKSFMQTFSIKTPPHKRLNEMMEHLITILDILQTSVIPFSVVYCNCCFGQEIFGERRKGGKCNEEWMTHPFSLEMATAKPLANKSRYRSILLESLAHGFQEVSWLNKLYMKKWSFSSEMNLYNKIQIIRCTFICI